jgi:hypothetical protein
MLQYMSVLTDEDTGAQTLIFQFTEGELSFECPTGLSAAEAIGVFKAFVSVAEDIIENEKTIH